MGWLVMSERELNRIEVLSEVESGRLRAEDAAGLLGLTRRQVFRLLARFRTDGPAGLVHRARGRAPNNALPAAHQVSELHDIHISHETLRKWMIADGLWLSRKHRRVLHQPRLQCEALGELVQIDGSEHRWFEDRGPACTLLVFIDDATGRLMHSGLVTSESNFSYFNALEGYLGQGLASRAGGTLADVRGPRC
ncbi:helix-turn-helix domain-containing protein [Paracoccus sp. Z118]|nr:helix-turn-helix domain-containing protein [Paracoccus sp. Z118]